MIISLDEAKKIDSSIDQDDLDAFEQAVRALTSNNFQVKQIRYQIKSIGEDSITLDAALQGVRKGDSIEVNYSMLNDGVYEVLDVVEGIVTLQAKLFPEEPKRAILTLVRYPADIKRGIKKLIQYDVKMSSKIGVKSETISRMSTTYFDVNASDNTDGYPKALLSFLDKYKKMRWS
ncbi:hypothetical protein MUB24_03420 [Lederbergia sp. NSJ-179]|uniref:hypothetical protein n=1 Tax=Lederbergia sp. NSJ-179 TaxID=2931402 RepID=UPI001FD3D84E|nr:hypothetical protein [Lederbergia sp. NSJ-179]MCJ7839977.1 hypothetical protein [Lederbergia sp. NSJ-179]